MPKRFNGLSHQALAGVKDSQSSKGSIPLRQFEVSLHGVLPVTYHSYTPALAKSDGISISYLDSSDLADVVALQSWVFSSLGDKTWLRENTIEVFEECLHDDIVIGARNDEGTLVALTIMKYTDRGVASYQRLLTADPQALDASCNLKLILVSSEWRRNGIGKMLIEFAKQHAARNGMSWMLCTISPSNLPSQKLFTSLGFEEMRKVHMDYGERLIFRLNLGIVS